MTWCGALGKETRGQQVDLSRYADLPEPGRRLIQGWWKRASARGQDPFESFIYMWVGFNAWGECVSGLETDRQWVEAVASNPDVRRRAERGMSGRDVADAFLAFHGMWPIFRLRDLKDAQVAQVTAENRRDLVAKYRAAGAKPNAPQCWESHETSAFPLDWPHLVFATYRVRNNLFHGTKLIDSESDRAIVGAAAVAFRAVVNASGLL